MPPRARKATRANGHSAGRRAVNDAARTAARHQVAADPGPRLEVAGSGGPIGVPSISSSTPSSGTGPSAGLTGRGWRPRR